MSSETRKKLTLNRTKRDKAKEEFRPRGLVLGRYHTNSVQLVIDPENPVLEKEITIAVYNPSRPSDQVKLAFDAPSNVKIYRGENFLDEKEEINQFQKQAAKKHLTDDWFIEIIRDKLKNKGMEELYSEAMEEALAKVNKLEI